MRTQNSQFWEANLLRTSVRGVTFGCHAPVNSAWGYLSGTEWRRARRLACVQANLLKGTVCSLGG